MGKPTSCFIVNSNDVILDNLWLWRADHAQDNTGWDVNPADNGITVNGNDVTAYGLFVEHFEKYQTLWNGNGGTTFFYQSELPYDVPHQGSWLAPTGRNGYASSKAAICSGATICARLASYSACVSTPDRNASSSAASFVDFLSAPHAAVKMTITARILFMVPSHLGQRNMRPK